MLEKIKKIWNLVRENQRYFWVFLVFIFVFIINKSLPAENIASEDCTDGKCQGSILEANLTNENPRYYLNDVLDSKSGEFYRIIFQTKTDKETSFSVFATNAFDENKEIKEFGIKNKNTDISNEVIFSSDGHYTDLLFQKNNPSDGSEIFVENILVSKLNISSEKEISGLMPTIIGGGNREVEGQKQIEDNFIFNQSKEPGILFGQVFQPDTDYITAVKLSMDITKQGSGGGRYSLELRDVEFESADVPKIKSDPLAEVKFSLEDLEKYRREDGKYLFPIVAKLDKNRKYFIGINNDKADVNDFNHLSLRGSAEKSSYPNGSAAAKYDKNAYLAPGNLYFKLYGFKIKNYQGVDILPGAVIEDRGRGQAFYSYNPQKNKYELLNLDSFSENISFEEGDAIIAGQIDEKTENPFYAYKFETVYPIKNFSISGEQGDASWNKSKISYSFDKNEWFEIPSESKIITDNQERQVFNFFTEEKTLKYSTVYLKIEPEKDKYPDQSSFGIKNFRFEAELQKKK